MESKKIKQFVEEYGSPVEIKDKDNYHTFKSTIADKLAEEEQSFRPRIGMKKRYLTNE